MNLGLSSVLGIFCSLDLCLQFEASVLRSRQLGLPAWSRFADASQQINCRNRLKARHIDVERVTVAKSEEFRIEASEPQNTGSKNWKPGTPRVASPTMPEELDYASSQSRSTVHSTVQ